MKPTNRIFSLVLILLVSFISTSFAESTNTQCTFPPDNGIVITDSDIDIMVCSGEYSEFNKEYSGNHPIVYIPGNIHEILSQQDSNTCYLDQFKPDQYAIPEKDNDIKVSYAMIPFLLLAFPKNSDKKKDKPVQFNILQFMTAEFDNVNGQFCIEGIWYDYDGVKLEMDLPDISDQKEDIATLKSLIEEQQKDFDKQKGLHTVLIDEVKALTQKVNAQEKAIKNLSK